MIFFSKKKLCHYDIQNAFLNGELEKEIYIQINPRCENAANRNRVCRLKQALYGLKQSPRAWFGKFTKIMKLLGHKLTLYQDDPSIEKSSYQK